MYDAKAILEGKTPYLEVFDHKGLYHIGVNILGLLINEAFGVFILEIIFQTITIFIVFEILHMTEMSIIEKAVAIGFLTEMGKGICEDAGEKTIGSALELSGAAAAFYVLLPLMQSVLDLMEEIL